MQRNSDLFVDPIISIRYKIEKNLLKQDPRFPASLHTLPDTAFSIGPVF